MSFAYYVKQPFRLVMLHDETVPEFAWDHFRRLFRGVVIADRDKLWPEVEEKLEPLSPIIVEMWKSGYYVTLPKIVDTWLLARNQTVVTLDADVLFFDCPDELLDASRVQDQLALYNYKENLSGGRKTAYAIDADEIEHDMGIKMPYHFIIGMGSVNMACYDWPLIEKVMSKHPPQGAYKHFMIDQSILGIWAASSGFSYLDKKRYAVMPVATLKNVVGRHYIAKTRDLMYVEGIRTLRKRWKI